MKQRGHTLIELLAVMTASMTLLGVAAGLLHRALRTQASTRHLLELEHSGLLLARQFRSDVAAATDIRITTDSAQAADVDTTTPLIRLQLPVAGEVVYQAGIKALHRYQDQRSSDAPLHEAYRMPAGMAWRAEQAGPLIRLNGRHAATTHARPHDIDILAALPPGLRMRGSQ